MAVFINSVQLCIYFMGRGFANRLTGPQPASTRSLAHPPQLPVSQPGWWSLPSSLETSVLSRRDAGQRSGRKESQTGSLVFGELKGAFKPFGTSKIPNTFWAKHCVCRDNETCVQISYTFTHFNRVLAGINHLVQKTLPRST